MQANESAESSALTFQSRRAKDNFLKLRFPSFPLQYNIANTNHQTLKCIAQKNGRKYQQVLNNSKSTLYCVISLKISSSPYCFKASYPVTWNEAFRKLPADKPNPFVKWRQKAGDLLLKGVFT
jgi:hypothetical protein